MSDEQNDIVALLNDLADYLPSISVHEAATLREAAEEIERLRAWKAEGIEVLEQWHSQVADLFGEALADPKNLGFTHASIVAAEIELLRAENERLGLAIDEERYEIERLRADRQTALSMVRDLMTHLVVGDD